MLCEIINNLKGDDVMSKFIKISLIILVVLAALFLVSILLFGVAKVSVK